MLMIFALEEDAVAMGGEVVQHDDVAGPQRGHQYLLDVREDTCAVDGPIEHGRRRQSLQSQGHTATKRGCATSSASVTAGGTLDVLTVVQITDERLNEHCSSSNF